MKKSSLCEKENARLEKMNKFQLNYSYKKIGWTVVIISFLLMIAKKFIDEPTYVKPILRNAMIIGLLLVSLAKDKIEDEMIQNVRAQSYRLAFIWGVLYALFLPYIDYGIEYLIDTQTATLNYDYFQILLSMLFVQILFFNTIKRSYQ